VDIAKIVEKKVQETIDKYGLFTKKDKILVALSGGKDSVTVLYVLKKLGYEVDAFYLDLHIGDWSKKNLIAVQELCKLLAVKLTVVDIRAELGSSMCFIHKGIKSKKPNLSNCLICGVIKRSLLNKKARELGATKIATGHNLDDEVEVYFMNLFKYNSDLLWGMGPQNGVTRDKKFVPRIKPLYFVTNKETKEFTQELKLPVVYEKCPCSSTSGIRNDIRKMVQELEKENPNLKKELIEKLQEKIKNKNFKVSGKITYCEKCGEPARGKICKSCDLFSSLCKSE